MKTTIVIMFLLLTECAAPQTVTLPDGREYVAKINTGTVARVQLSEHHEIVFDRKGRASIFEDLLKMLALNQINKD